MAPERTTIIALVPTCKLFVVPSAIGPTSKSSSQTKVYSLRIVQEDEDIQKGAPAVHRVTTGNHQNGSLDPFSFHLSREYAGLKTASRARVRPSVPKLALFLSAAEGMEKCDYLPAG